MKTLTYNVPVLGNVTVEAPSEQEAIRRVQNALDNGYTLDDLPIEIFASLDIDTTGVSQL